MADKKISEDALISTINGTEYFPLIQDGVNVRMMLTTLLALSSSGEEITNGATITLLTTNSNWDSIYGKDYTGSAITGNEHDYCIGQDSVTGSWYKYTLLNVSATLTPIRIPILLS